MTDEMSAGQSQPESPRSGLPTVYLAGGVVRSWEIRQYAELLQRLGYTVTSRWLWDVAHGTAQDDPEHGSVDDYAKRAAEDLHDVEECDWFVAFSGAATTTGGRHVEFGYALARNKRCFLIGERENVFHCLLLDEFVYKGFGGFYDMAEKRAQASAAARAEKWGGCLKCGSEDLVEVTAVGLRPGWQQYCCSQCGYTSIRKRRYPREAPTTSRLFHIVPDPEVPKDLMVVVPCKRDVILEGDTVLDWDNAKVGKLSREVGL